MEVKIKFSTGKEIELTADELQELFGVGKVIHNHHYIPSLPAVPPNTWQEPYRNPWIEPYVTWTTSKH